MESTAKQLTIARHYLAVGQPARALAALDGLAGDALNDTLVSALRGQALYELDRYDEAAAIARAGLAHTPESIALLYLLCNCEAQLGDLAAAERAILSALRLDPEDPDLLCRYAHLVAMAGQLAKAERLVDEAARLDPDAPAVARARVALAYVRADDRAVDRQSRQLLMADPDDDYGHRMLGVAMANTGQMAPAARHLGVAVRLDPTDRELAEAARESRLWAHPLLWPLRPLNSFSPARVYIWLGMIALVFVLLALGYDWAPGLILVLVLVYCVFCVYSWVAPPLLRLWLRWRDR